MPINLNGTRELSVGVYMVCYAVPTVAAITHFFIKGKLPSWKNKHQDWLTLMLFGGSVFGIVDHWWNGELFLIGPNILADLLLGATITVAIILLWAVIVAIDTIIAASTLAVENKSNKICLKNNLYKVKK